jgi:hypothetical protein
MENEMHLVLREHGYQKLAGVQNPCFNIGFMFIQFTWQKWSAERMSFKVSRN